MQAQQAAAEIQDVLEERSPRALGTIAFSTTGGVILAQEVADRVLPLAGLPRNPQTATEFGASGLVKTGVAAGMGAVATRLSGMPLLVSAFAGVGALAGAGADFVNALQRTGLLAEQGSLGNVSASASTGASRPRPSGSSSPSGNSGGGGTSEIRV